MKAKVIVSLIMILLLPVLVNAQLSDCSARGALYLDMDKADFQPGESLLGKITILNKNPQDSRATLSLKLFWEGKPVFNLVKAKTANPGNSSFTIKSIFFAGIHGDAQAGKWVVQLTVAMDNCVWTETEVVGVFSCSDKSLNGDEEGVDCGGSCKQECKILATTTTVQ